MVAVWDLQKILSNLNCYVKMKREGSSFGSRDVSECFVCFGVGFSH